MCDEGWPANRRPRRWRGAGWYPGPDSQPACWRSQAGWEPARIIHPRDFKSWITNWQTVSYGMYVKIVKWNIYANVANWGSDMGYAFSPSALWGSCFTWHSAYKSRNARLLQKSWISLSGLLVRNNQCYLVSGSVSRYYNRDSQLFLCISPQFVSGFHLYLQ